MELRHYSPRPIDDSFSVAVFENLLNMADQRRLLFTDAEYRQLSVYKTKLDNEINGDGWAFADQFSAVYKNALKRADTIINKIFQKPFDYNLAETVGTTKRKHDFTFAADPAALANRWSRYLKFLILSEVYEAASADSSRKMSLKAALPKREAAIRENVKKAELRGLSKTLDNPAGYDVVIADMYLNAIATCFDPHSNYFSPQANEEFQSSLSTEAYFFGIGFKENDKGVVVIEKLSPGGAAWKSGEINKGDELVSLQWEGKEAQDMTGASLEEVYKVLDLSIHDKLMFRLRKADGTMSNVYLRKEKEENEENIVKSFVLKGDKKIGYILLPGFYTEWGMGTGSSCANDVAKEIVKLKKENIEGLILDVRFNGGGSIEEALEMTGIFIDEGPITIDKTSDGKLATLKDPNRGTIYDGPMVLLVNGQSASASELLAASLQDYHRAVIVGSNTYGKATMQQMFPMDTVTTRPFTGNTKIDIVKITVGKIFRITGQTAQLFGVTPDVELPDAFDGLEIGEKFMEYALPADSVKRNNYYKPLPYLPVDELARLSAARVNANPVFTDIRKIAADQQKMMQAVTQTIPLKAELFETWIQNRELDLKTMKGEGENATEFTTENHAAGKLSLQNNPFASEMNEVWLKNLGKDIYIREAYLVLNDLINFLKRAH